MNPQWPWWMKALRWIAEFIVVILGGVMFVRIVGNTYIGSESNEYLLLYLTGVIWIAALRIVSAIKKKDSDKDLPE